MPVDLRQRYQVIQWLMFQIGNLGPMLGQAHYFRRYAKEQIAYAIECYTREVKRLYLCSTSDWAKLNFSLATTPLLIWRSIPAASP